MAAGLTAGTAAATVSFLTHKDLLLSDHDRLARWIAESGDVGLIADPTDARSIGPATLRRWVRTSEAAMMVTVDAEPIAFATLSRAEAELPPGFLEACHIIVRPEWRRLYHGTNLVYTLCREARWRGFGNLVGRVFPTNHPARELLSSAGWSLIQDSRAWMIDGFVWYDRHVMV